MKILKVFELLKKRHRRFSRIYDLDLLLEMGMRTFVEINKFFLKEDLKKLEHLICLQYHLRHRLQSSKSERILSLKLSRLNVEGNSLFGIAIGVHLRSSYELLEEKHIFRALVNLLPGIKVIPESFYCCREREQCFLFCYLEIEKLRGHNFTFRDMELLRTQLPIELKKNIQSLTSSLLCSRNEEDAYKSVIRLAEELKSKLDRPQVVILFQSQIQETLLFRVILVRARKKNTPSFDPEKCPLPSSCYLTLEKILPLGVFPEGDLKEAILFSIETECALFLGKNWSIDLDQARNYVAKFVEQVFGHFRDYNGGLLSLQNKQLEHIEKHLCRKNKHFHVLIQDIFHSFRPASFQALLRVSSASRFFSFVISHLRDKNFNEEKIKKKRNGNSLFILIKMTPLAFHHAFLKEMKNIQKEMPSAAGYTFFEHEKEHYFCSIDLDISLGSKVLAHLELAIKRIHEHKVSNGEQKILRINFQDGDLPSLNPQIAIDQRCRSLGKALFEGLTRLNDNNEPEPAAAREIRCSSQTLYTFILRKHHWSNGKEVSAFDFEQSWKKAIAPHSHCLRSDLFFIIKNAQQAHLGLKPLDEVKIKAVNAKTLVVELEYPVPYFLHLLANPIFSPLYEGEQEPYHFNGPFLLKAWKRDHWLQLTANPYYWDKQNVQLKDITISMVKDTNLICEQFETAKIDWLGDPFTTPLLKSLHPQIWQQKEVSRIYWIYLNTRIFPLLSSNIRKALACAINRRELTQKVRAIPFIFNSTLSWDGNVSLARDFFREGLKELKISQNAFPELTFYWNADEELEWAQMVQEQIQSALEIKISLKNREWNSLSYLLDKREYQMASCFRTLSPFYSQSYLELFRDRSNLYNSSQWENSSFQMHLDRALQCFQEEEKERHLAEAEQILLNEMPVIPIFFPNYLYLLSNRIKKVTVASNGDVDFKWISMT